MKISNNYCLIVIPIKNEPGIIELIKELHNYISLLKNAEGIKILIVDDSTNPYFYNDLAIFAESNKTWLVQIPGEHKGLGEAILKGITIAKEEDFEFVLLMDGDGQHPINLIPKMIDLSQYYEVVLPSRFIDGASSAGLDGFLRNALSYLLRFIPRCLFPKIKGVTDPLSGSFLINVDAIKITKLKAESWKMLLEVLLFSDWFDFAQIPYTFQERKKGKSKMNFKEALNFFKHIPSLFFRYYF